MLIYSTKMPQRESLSERFIEPEQENRREGDQVAVRETRGFAQVQS